MEALQQVFNNREIAIGIWSIITILVLLFTKPARQFLRTAIPILFCKKFVIFYIVFISFLIAVIHFLKWTTFWDMTLLKNTIFWVIFIEMPLFVKTIENAKDARFFKKLIEDNLKAIVAFEFFVDFWTFSLSLELIIIPVSIFIALLVAIASREKKHKPAKNFLNALIGTWSVVLIINAIYNTVCFPDQFFNTDTLKTFVLPLILLVLNLPVVYGLALYNGYEQLFIKIKDGAKHKIRMKLQLFLFCGLNLYKVTSVRRHIASTILVSLKPEDLQKNLSDLKKKLSLQIGDNYMKRSNFYLWSCVLAGIASLIGLILANSQASIKELLTFDFVLNVERLKEILTYVFSVSLVFSFALFLHAIGFRKKKNEEISQIKKYALFEFLFTLKQQKERLQEYPPIDDPASVYVNYILVANELKTACAKALDAYSNLLTVWERESIESLQSSAIALMINVTIGTKGIEEYDVKSFCAYYEEKRASSQYSDTFNSFTNPLKTDIEKYTKKIENTYEDFKNYF